MEGIKIKKERKKNENLVTRIRIELNGYSIPPTSSYG